MTKLDELLNMWAKDSVIDRTEPGKELINIPQLHSKYLNVLSRHRLLAKEAEFKYNRMKKVKWEYLKVASAVMVVSGLSVVDIGNEDTLVGNTSINLNL